MGNSDKEKAIVSMAEAQVMKRITGSKLKSDAITGEEESKGRQIVLALNKGIEEMASHDKPVDQIGKVRVTASMNATSEEEIDLGKDVDLEQDELLQTNAGKGTDPMLLTLMSDSNAEGYKVVTQEPAATLSPPKNTAGEQQQDNFEAQMHKADFPPLPKRQNTRPVLNRPSNYTAAPGQNAKVNQPRPNAWNNRPRINKGVGSKLWKVAEQGPLRFKRSEMPTVEDTWGFCLVGRFAGRFPGIKALDNIRNSWKVKHSLRTEASFLIFGFDCEEDRDSVLKAGPYFAYDKPLLLKNMPSLFAFNKEALATIPIWVRIHGMPTELWSKEALSRIASRIGMPLFVDPVTEQRRKGSYARVLVEVNFAIPVMREIKIEYDDGLCFECPLVYENEQVFCSICNGFGHLEKRCLFKVHEEKSEHTTEQTEAEQKIHTEVNEQGQKDQVTEHKGKVEEYPADTAAATHAEASSDSKKKKTVQTSPEGIKTQEQGADNKLNPQISTSNMFLPLQDVSKDERKAKEEGVTASEDSDDTRQDPESEYDGSADGTEDNQSVIKQREGKEAELIDKGGTGMIVRRATRQSMKNKPNEIKKGAGTPSKRRRR